MPKITIPGPSKSLPKLVPGHVYQRTAPTSCYNGSLYLAVTDPKDRSNVLLFALLGGGLWSNSGFGFSSWKPSDWADIGPITVEVES